MQLNTFLFNGSLFNNLSGVVPVTADLSEVSFAGYPLNSGASFVTEISHEPMPTRDRDTFPLPRGDGGGSLGDYWRGRRIRVSGYLTAATHDELDAAIDSFKQSMATENGSLRVVVNGAVRVFSGTLTNGQSVFDRQHFHQTFIPYQLEFDCFTPDGYGRGESYTSVEFLGQTSLAYTEESPHAGTARANAIVTVNFTAESGITAVSFKNNTRDETISVSASFAPADLLVIDGEAKTVKINGAEVDYSGTFPKLNPGVNNFTLTLTGTSATYDLTVSHKATYL